MPCIVLTGAPGVGKTTLLAELATLGYATVPESARAVIAERLAAGLTPRPDPYDFASELHHRDRKKLEEHKDREELVFFDRCAVESLAMLHEITPLNDHELRRRLGELNFHRRAFLLPVWREIYRTDAERDHTFAHAEQVHEALMRWYVACGYEVIEVPRGSVRERARFVLDALKREA